MATIFDIAKKAGVSITTVSRALNGYSDVSAETRRRVSEIAEELAYYPSATARNLQSKKTNTIAFAPQLHNRNEPDPFLKELIGTLALSCLDHNLSLLVSLTSSQRSMPEVYRELAGSGRVDGMILADTTLQDERIDLLCQLDIPFIAFGRTADFDRRDYPFVDVDGKAGLEALVDYLYEQGHRQIAYLSEPFHYTCMYDRYLGYEASIQKHGLQKIAERLVVGNMTSDQEVREAVIRLLELPASRRPTAIVTGHDRLALIVLETLKNQGVPVGKEPGCVAVTGFDDLPFAAYLQPGLTTLRQPIDITCAVLLDLLVALLKNRDEPALEHIYPGAVQIGAKQILLKPQLVIRASA